MENHHTQSQPYAQLFRVQLRNNKNNLNRPHLCRFFFTFIYILFRLCVGLMIEQMFFNVPFYSSFLCMNFIFFFYWAWSALLCRADYNAEEREESTQHGGKIDISVEPFGYFTIYRRLMDQKERIAIDGRSRRSC